MDDCVKWADDIVSYIDLGRLNHIVAHVLISGKYWIFVQRINIILYHDSSGLTCKLSLEM